jgi:hypothetical protein
MMVPLSKAVERSTKIAMTVLRRPMPRDVYCEGASQCGRLCYTQNDAKRGADAGSMALSDVSALTCFDSWWPNSILAVACFDFWTRRRAASPDEQPSV